MEATELNSIAISSRMSTPAGEGILIAWERGWGLNPFEFRASVRTK